VGEVAIALDSYSGHSSNVDWVKQLINLHWCLQSFSYCNAHWNHQFTFSNKSPGV